MRVLDSSMTWLWETELIEGFKLLIINFLLKRFELFLLFIWLELIYLLNLIRLIDWPFKSTLSLDYWFFVFTNVGSSSTCRGSSRILICYRESLFSIILDYETIAPFSAFVLFGICTYISLHSCLSFSLLNLSALLSDNEKSKLSTIVLFYKEFYNIYLWIFLLSLILKVYKQLSLQF